MWALLRVLKGQCANETKVSCKLNAQPTELLHKAIKKVTIYCFQVLCRKGQKSKQKHIGHLFWPIFQPFNNQCALNGT